MVTQLKNVHQANLDRKHPVEFHDLTFSVTDATTGLSYEVTLDVRSCPGTHPMDTNKYSYVLVYYEKSCPHAVYMRRYNKTTKKYTVYNSCGTGHSCWIRINTLMFSCIMRKVVPMPSTCGDITRQL